MPRRRRRRRRAPDTLTPDQAAELACGPTPRGSWFASPAERDRLRRLHELPASPAVAARERHLDAAREAFRATRRAARIITEEE